MNFNYYNTYIINKFLFLVIQNYSNLFNMFILVRIN